MLRANRMACLIVGTLLSTAGLADDGILEYASRWQLINPIETMAYADDWPQPMNNFDFQDSGILGRASRLRGLSFLTLAEIGRARLFLGVNKEGLVGLHFRAFSRHSSSRYLELARMPYLKNSQPDTETD
ncbi:MAG: hypothetical protein WBM80_10905 [Woeseiaceae bacterium]